MNIKDEITNGENLMNTKIETFLTYMLVLFLTIAFESSLRAANKSSQLDLTFNSRIPPMVHRDNAIKITDVADHDIYSTDKPDIQAYYNSQGSFVLRAKFRPIKVVIAGTAANNNLVLTVTSFYISSRAFLFSEKGVDLITTPRKTHGNSQPWNELWKLNISNPNTGEEGRMFHNNYLQSLQPDQNNGKTYTLELMPMLTIPKSEINPAGGQINGTVRVNFSADITP